MHDRSTNKPHPDGVLQVVSDFPLVYLLRVAYPNVAGKSTNVYIIPGEDGALLVDAGFFGQASLACVESALAQLGLAGAPLEVFVTHLHLDHAGLIPQLASWHELRVYVGRREHAEMVALADPERGPQREWGHLAANGVDPAVIAQARSMGSHSLCLPEGLNVVVVDSGQVLTWDKRRYEVLGLSGHVPGHMGLWQSDSRLLFSGDHLLFSVTPTLQPDPDAPDALSRYFKNLDAVCSLRPRALLHSHGAIKDGYEDRARWIIDHQRRRMERAFELVRSEPGSCGEDIIKQLGWNLGGLSWDEVNVPLRICVLETGVVVLDQLVADGRVMREIQDGVFRYFAL